MVQSEAHPDANVIFGVAFDPALEDEMRVTVIATGFDSVPKSMQNTVEAQAARAAAAAAAPAEKAEAEAEAPVKKDSGDVISESDFDEILGILNSNR